MWLLVPAIRSSSPFLLSNATSDLCCGAGQWGRGGPWWEPAHAWCSLCGSRQGLREVLAVGLSGWGRGAVAVLHLAADVLGGLHWGIAEPVPRQGCQAPHG